MVAKSHRNRDDISRDTLSDVNVVVFGGSREKFLDREYEELKAWLNAGGRALILMGDMHDKEASNGNLNTLLNE